MSSRDVGRGNGEFLAHVAMGVPKEELRERWKAGRYRNLHEELARWALKQRGW